MPSHKIIKTGAIIFDLSLSYILAVQGRISNKWGPPKGHLAAGETILQGAIREVREETGLQLTDLGPMVNIEGVYLFVTAIALDSPVYIADAEEINQIAWLDLSDANIEDTYPLTKVMRKIFRRQDYLRTRWTGSPGYPKS